jgi:alpha-L-fucosidase 2
VPNDMEKNMFWLSDPSDLKLFYRQPANAWTQALPLGNGRLGAMVFGQVHRERLQLNESTLWSGGPKDCNNPHARAVLPELRQALFARDFIRADALCKKMQGPFNQSYLPLGDLHLHWPSTGDVAEYRRELDLRTAIARVQFRHDGAWWTREAFISFPDQVLVIHLTCDRPEAIFINATLTSPLRFQVRSENGLLVMRGRCPAHVEPSYMDGLDPERIKTKGAVIYDDGPNPEGMTFDARLMAVADRGLVACGNRELTVERANELTLLFSAATSFNGFKRSPGRDGRDPSVEAARCLSAAAALSYRELRQRHVQDYQRLFDRVSLTIGRGADARGPEATLSAANRVETVALPTDERLRRFAQSDDPGLAVLLFQFGRYLLISSSRAGGQPANLQGIWNDRVRPPWSCNWTLNINTEMNYWPAENCNLSECHQPLFDLIEGLVENGRRTAEINYGCRGWVAHHNADLWRQTAPPGDGIHNPVCINWPMGGAWLCRHLWEHYQYTGDKEFLAQRAWPYMKGAAEFFLDFLVEDSSGHLVTAPSTSPELMFMTPAGPAATSVGSTMDMAIVWDLFSNCLATAEILGVDEPLARQLAAARGRLLKPRIGAGGRLQEWSEDFQEQEVHHRHISHLYGLFPGAQITPHGTPDLAAAARQSLAIRGDGGTGWSLGWKMNVWARLQDGPHVYAIIRRLMTLVDTNETDYSNSKGGLYANLLDAHPPFQIDGNFAFSACMAEMLVQSHTGELLLLPALPPVWPQGQVRGLVARGGVEVDLAWGKGALVSATLRARQAGRWIVRYKDAVKDLALAAGESATFAMP